MARWVAGQDAVFEGNGGTVTVTNAVSANSLSFFNSGVNNMGGIVASTGSYTLTGGTITLTGDAMITTGAGTNNNAGSGDGGSSDVVTSTSNPGGGTNYISSVLTGSVGMYKAGSGTLVLTGANNYTGDTTVGGGTLQIGNGGATGSILGDVSNLANLAFNHSNTFTFNGAISGTGSVDILDTSTSTTNTTVFTGNHTYAGITTIYGGTAQHGNTLQLGNGGTAGSITGDVVVNANATLAFNRSDAPATPFVYGGIIYGAGGVTQMGTGKTVLTSAGVYSANVYTGTTTVSAGTLQINGASPTTNVLTNAGGAERHRRQVDLGLHHHRLRSGKHDPVVSPHGL